MISIKRFLLFYLINLLFLSLITLLFGDSLATWIPQLIFWLFPLIFALFGQITGLIGSVFTVNQKKKKRSFLIMYIISSSAFVSFIFFSKYSYWRHNKDYGNIESNKSAIKFFHDGYKREVSVAFLKLESQFKNPNSIRVKGISVSHRDTLVNGYAETAYTFRFTYLIVPDTTKFFSEILVVENEPHLLTLNSILRDADLEKFNNFPIEAMKNIKEGLDMLPDSIQKDIIDKVRSWEK